jgi:hypothetical protein
MDFLVEKTDLESTRFVDEPPAEVEDGQALLSIDSFGLTANNITYAAFGERMSYWDFFPGPEGWGRVPVWGFADVAESRAAGLAAGTRVYGYLPPSTHLLVSPARTGERGFVDGSPHRSGLSAVYNSYATAAHDPIYTAASEDLQMLLRPLFFTSYLIDDFLLAADFFGAVNVVLSSASSKTSSGLAFLLAQREGIEVIGLTSRRSGDFARSLEVYDDVVSYDDAEALPAGRTVYVDMAGDEGVRDAVHGRYRDELAHSSVVGATHHDRLGQVPDDLPGARPKFFFAPDRIAARTAEWGRAGLEQRMAEAWAPYMEWAGRWLKVERAAGPQALESAYRDLLAGRIDPASAHVLSL